MNNKFLTLGIDVGGSYIKAVLIDYADDQKIILSKTEKSGREIQLTWLMNL